MIQGYPEQCYLSSFTFVFFMLPPKIAWAHYSSSGVHSILRPFPLERLSAILYALASMIQLTPQPIFTQKSASCDGGDCFNAAAKVC